MWEIIHTHLFNHHILPTAFLLIFAETWLWVPYLITCILYLNLYLQIGIILWMTLSHILPFQTLHMFWMKIDLSTELVLHNQHALKFMKSVTGSLNIHWQQRTIPIYPYLLHFFLASLVILPSLIFHVYLRRQKHPLLIIHRTHWMSVHHLTMERTNHSFNIHLIFIYLFQKCRGWTFLLLIYPSVQFIESWGCHPTS